MIPRKAGLDLVSPAPRRGKRIVGAVLAALAVTFAFVAVSMPSAQAASTVRLASSADTVAPTVPGGLGYSISCALVVTLHWTASTDDVGVTGYDVYRSTNNDPFALVTTTPTTSYTDSILGFQNYEIRARDAAGNVSAFTAVVNIVPPPCAAPQDTQPPTTPGPITVSINCSLAVTLTWGASTDNVALFGYDVYRATNGGPFVSVATTPTTSFTETLLGIEKYEVRARDTSANVSAFTASVLAVPPPCPPPVDTQPPTTPGTPTASGTTGSATTLTWTASTDNVQVTRYDIYRASGASGGTFASVGTSTTNSFTDAGLAPGATYRYMVLARDAAGNASAFSAVVVVTTPAGGCSATLRLQASWYNGYVMQPNAVTNTGTAAINGWTVTFTLPAGHTITGSWNAVVTVAGQTVTARGIAGQNAVLGAGATTTWGFQATRPSGNTAVPAGATCTHP
jgi:fibronectin type 3 domain-containing protein